MINYKVLFLIVIFLFSALLFLYIWKSRQNKKLLYDLSETSGHLKRLINLRGSMLEITQAVVGTEDPRHLYEMILEKTILAIPNANVGSVMIRGEDDLFRCFSQKGFDKDKIKDFSLPLKETILYKYTGGKIEKAIIIRDTEEIEDIKFFPLSANSNEWHIRSSIIVPLFVDKELKGILHIDSKEVDAFTNDDMLSIEYIRGNIEVALQKYLLYTKMVILSRYDELTKTYNRTYFMEHFNHILNNALRYKQTFSLGIFDINDLKKINDTQGHIAGDRILQKFAEVTIKNIRKTDIFARWGGDEFMAIFYQFEDDDINDKIEHIRASLKENPLIIGNDQIRAQFSFGSATYPEEGTNFDDLLRLADKRMYLHKREMKKT